MAADRGFRAGDEPTQGSGVERPGNLNPSSLAGVGADRLAGMTSVPSASDPSSTDLPLAALNAFALLAAGELVSFARLADDAAHAPELRTRIVLSRMAAADLAPLDEVERFLAEFGIDPEVLDDRIWEFREVLAEFDSRTPPRDWWERLVRTYIGYGLMLDLQTAVCQGLQGEAIEVSSDALGDAGLADYVVATLGPAIEADAQLGARLALWGRRVVGEALGIASRLLLSNPGLAQAAGAADESGRPVPEQVSGVLNGLTSQHARRMGRLGLTA